MSVRECDVCGTKMGPYTPRKRVGEHMLCPACEKTERGGYVSATPKTAAHHDDNFYHLSGCYHTSCGRWLGDKGITHEGNLWRPPDPGFRPVHHLLQGANDYAQSRGLPPSHDHDYSGINRDPEDIRRVGEAYDKLPVHDENAHASFKAMRDDVHSQFHHLTHNLGVDVSTVDHDPYRNFGEMHHDMERNHRLKVLNTATTGGHPFFSNEDNDKFRAVHDAFGHAATGRGTDRHGEEAAWQAHSRMFSPEARGALGSETRGQNSSLILNGRFAPQKVALLPKEFTKSALQKDAHDSGDSAIIFHCPSCGSGQVIAQSDGSTKCEFCNMAFTVQVQPQFNAYPQTIDGQPVDVPNMPGEIDNPVLDAAQVGPDGEPMGPPGAEGDFPPGEEGGGDAPPFGADEVDEEGDGSPVAKEEQDDAKAGAEKKDESHSNPFGKKSMLTENGVALSLDDFKRHLALKFSFDREAVLDAIRRNR